MGSEDVRVLGLVAGIHVVEDIGVSVPLGVTVSIPSDRAGMSKDLWRAVGQKKLFQWPQGTAPQHVAPTTHVRDDVLQARNLFLEERVRQLEEENRQLRHSLEAALAQQERLDRILLARPTARWRMGPRRSSSRVKSHRRTLLPGSTWSSRKGRTRTCSTRRPSCASSGGRTVRLLSTFAW